MALVALIGCALAAFWAGARSQRYTQARADVRDTRLKLRKAREVRSAQRGSAVVGWIALGAVVVLAVASVIAGANG